MNPVAEPVAEELVVDFLNTVDVEAVTDELVDEAAWAAWSRDRGLAAGPVEVARACREVLRARAAALENADRVELGELPAVPLTLVLQRDGTPALVPAGAPGAPDACGAVLAAVATLGLQGRLDRVKICPADDCLWAFYDRSRNQSRQWCSMAVCGNRAKTRAFRSRT